MRRNISNYFHLIKFTNIFFILALILLAGCGSENGGEDASTSSSDSSSTTALCNTNDAGTNGKITIAWDIPTEYSNNAPLDSSEIDGYKVYFGTQTKHYNNVIFVNNPGLTSCEISFNPSDSANTYFISMTVVTKNGLESDYSNEIIRTI